jgi:branched-chain amino acid transport system permease protein
MNLNKYMPIGVTAAIIIILQLFLFILDFNFLLTQIIMSAYYVLAGIGLCMLMGYAGQMSLGQAGFFAIGGYTTAVISTINLISYSDSSLIQFLKKVGLLVFYKNSYNIEILHITPWIALFITVIITVIIAFLIGLPIISLKGHYLAMATLGFGVIIYRVVLGTKLFGQADGITNLPDFKVFPGMTVSGDFSCRIQNYYFAWALVIIGLIILTNLINSRVGRALRSLHGSEEASNAMGVNTSQYKLKVFILSALFASTAGFFLTHFNAGIGPSEAHVMKSVRYVSIVAVGGMANLYGTLIMGTLLNFLSLRGIFGSYDDAVFGFILILVMLFAPNGFLNIRLLEKVKIFIMKIKGKKSAHSTNKQS